MSFIGDARKVISIPYLQKQPHGALDSGIVKELDLYGGHLGFKEF